MIGRLLVAWMAAFAAAFGAALGFPSPTISFVIDVQGCPASSSVYHPTAGDVARYARYWNDRTVRGGAAWFFDACTADPRFALSPASDHAVFPAIVPVPCAGRTPYSNMAYNSSANCGLLELYAYQEIAAAAYAKHTGRNLTIYRRLVVNVPMNCQFYGVGSRGCAASPPPPPAVGSCYVWIRTDRSFFWTVPGQTSPLMHTVVHELGHTLALQHSANVEDVPRPGAAFWEYGDASCVMGSAGSAETCFNAPHARQLGFARAVADLDDARLSPLGACTSLRLPAFTPTSKFNHVTLKSAGVPATIFLSVRLRNASRSGADGQLSADYDRVLSVHAHRDATRKTEVVALVPVGATLTLRPSTRLRDNDYLADEQQPDLFANMAANIAIRLVSLSPSAGAVVSICRLPKNGSLAVPI